jgi:hypothetical protein
MRSERVLKILRILCCGIAVVALAGCLHPPIAWSPDGQWLAYTTVARPPRRALETDWLYPDSSDRPIWRAQRRASDSPRLTPSKVASPRYRLWTTRADPGASVLLEDSPGPITPPCWRPNGAALAFGRITTDDAGGRFEVVVQDGPTHQVVIYSEPFARGDFGFDGADVPADLPGFAIAYSPDGRYLATPRIKPRGLAILVAETGRITRTIDDAYFPAWSPVGSQIACIRRGESEGLYLADARGVDAPRLLLDLGADLPVIAPPIWSRDGKTILVVGRDPGNRSAERVELMRVSVDTGRVGFEGPPSSERDATTLGFSFALDPEGDDLFTTMSAEGKNSTIVWRKLREKEVRKVFNPIDPSIPLGAISVCPTNRKLAFRAGVADMLASPAICDPEDEHVRMLTPDDSARVEWVALLVQASAKLIPQVYSGPTRNGGGGGRPTILPVPGEAIVDPAAAQRLTKLIKLGRPLCDRPVGSPAAERDIEAILDEARLYFDYLAGRYDEARAGLERVAARATSADHRLRLLGLRAQILLGRRDFNRAGSIIAYILDETKRNVTRLEETPAGFVLTPERDTQADWPEYLERRARLLESQKAVSEVDEAERLERRALFLEMQEEIPLPPGDFPIENRPLPRRPFQEGFAPDPKAFIPPQEGDGLPFNPLENELIKRFLRDDPDEPR